MKHTVCPILLGIRLAVVDIIQTDCFVVTSQQDERCPASINGLGHHPLNADLAVLSGL
jgi:hypothetical protein